MEREMKKWEDGQRETERRRDEGMQSDGKRQKETWR